MTVKNKKRVQVSLSIEFFELLAILAERKGLSKSAILTLALENYAKKEQKK